MKSKAIFLLILFVAIVAFFFRPFFLEGKIPIPADALVGMYHPFRDFFKEQYARGFPFKNFLITDPVRQQYPWRYLSVVNWKQLKIPGWNPYQLTGTPLSANFQSAAFYPFNFIFCLLPFNLAWTILILLQPLLAGLFLYLYLRHLKISTWPSFLGALSFAFSGFMVAWLEWGTIGHTILWLPLILLSIDKIIKSLKKRWCSVFVIALLFSFLAGHLQTAFYVILFSLIYLIWRLFQIKDKQKRKKFIFFFTIFYLLFIILSLPQWWPTLRLIKLSARAIDLDWQKPGWFLPWQHLTQLLAPDFFGNPTTMNYWGEWNYAEFVGFIGVIPLVLSFLAIISHHRREIIFFSLVTLLGLSFALPTPWAKMIYQLEIPLLATSQPTRLIGVVSFCLSVLAAFGLEKLISGKSQVFKTLFLATSVFAALWLFVFFGQASQDNLLVSRRNLILPTVMLIAFWFLTLVWQRIRFLRQVAIIGLLSLTVFDLLRFGNKFTPFSSQEFIFPKTKAIEFLQEQRKKELPFRIMVVDKEILPPNVASVYQLEEIAGYDPLYLLRYGELMAASERGQSDIAPPFGFNRIIAPANFESKIIDFLNVRHILSLRQLQSEKLKLVFEEGETKIYENKNSFPRAFLVADYQIVQNRQEAINLLMSDKIDLSETVVLEEVIDYEKAVYKGSGQVEIVDYQPERVVLKTITAQPAILVLSDAFYPGWSVHVDGQLATVYRANYNYRAAVVPEGEHEIIFSYSIW